MIQFGESGGFFFLQVSKGLCELGVIMVLAYLDVEDDIFCWECSFYADHNGFALTRPIGGSGVAV